MPVLSDVAVHDAVVAAGFPLQKQSVAVAIALAESGGNTDATHSNSDGSTDYGLFQINSVHSDLLNGTNWRDPVANAKMAFAISGGGMNWRPWTTYTSGAYLAYAHRGALVTPDAPGTGTGQFKSASGGDGWGGIAGFFGAITNGHTWVRVLYVLAGYVILLYAFSRLTDWDNKAVKIGAQLAVAKKVMG